MFSCPVCSTTCTTPSIGPVPMRHVLRPHAEARRARRPRPRASASSVSDTPGALERQRPPSCDSRPSIRFIAGVPMKPATKRFAGSLVDLRRRRELLQPPALHHRDAVRHRHRLELVVGDVDHRRARAGGAARPARPACSRAAWRRGSTAARRAGRPCGSRTSARPSATRCCWPPDSCRGLRSQQRRRAAAARAAFATCAARSAFGTPRFFSG